MSMIVKEFTDFIKKMARLSAKKTENLQGTDEIIFINKDGDESDFYFEFSREKRAILLIENENEEEN